MTPTIRLLDLPIHPTPEQIHHLRQLRAECGLVALATAEQAYWRVADHDVAIAALLGGSDHPDRSAEGEAHGLREGSDVAAVPLDLLINAVVSQRAHLAVPDAGSAPTVRVPVPLGGARWVVGAVATGLHLAGVPGVITAPVARIHRAFGDLGAHQRVVLTGAAWAERGHGDHTWSLDVELSLVRV